VGRRIRPDADPHGWRREAKDLLRALTGGAIVGAPLLYTMEVWQTGAVLHEWRLIGILAAALTLNFMFSLFSGFRRGYSCGEALSEAITAVALGVVFSATILTLIGELDWSGALIENAGKVVTAGLAVSLGAAFANSQVGDRSRTGSEASSGGEAIRRRPQDDDPDQRQLRADLSDAAATVAGSTVFALNIAPTEEVLTIAARLSNWQLLALLAVMTTLCYIILFASGFEKHHVYVDSVLQNPVAETVMATALSLAVAAVLLLLVGRQELLGHPSMTLSGVIVLGLPAVIGGAAGRLIV
jgi:putative integral membrane protein (TIGR02587 family)